MRWSFFWLLGAVLVANPHVAHASACCGSGHGLGQRLGRDETAAFTLSTRFADRFGSYNVHKQFVPSPTNGFDGELRTDIAAIFAPISRLQLGFVVPFIVNGRRFGETSDVGGGLGDLGATARFDLVPLSTSSDWPAIALTASITLPTGRSALHAQQILAADATGLGVAEFRPGVFLEHTFQGRASAIVAGSVGFRTELNEPPAPRIALAPRWRLLAAAGPVFDMGLSLSIGLIHEREGAPAIEGVTALEADRQRTAALVFVGYDLPLHWTLLGSAELDVPIHSFGHNELASIAISLGLRRSFSWEE